MLSSSGLQTILLLIMSNIFMTFAWYGHLRLKEFEWFTNLSLFLVILLSWGIAFFEYCFMIPANRIGFNENGGPFSLVELKVMQEVITLAVFLVFTLVFFKTETLKPNHFIGFAFLILAVYFIFKK
ncbi:MAG TPA: DMT family protein [Ignavibacteria bacterium]|nr:DMT family protein [Ignavibacteria bacterium]